MVFPQDDAKNNDPPKVKESKKTISQQFQSRFLKAIGGSSLPIQDEVNNVTTKLDDLASLLKNGDTAEKKQLLLMLNASRQLLGERSYTNLPKMPQEYAISLSPNNSSISEKCKELWEAIGAWVKSGYKRTAKAEVDKLIQETENAIKNQPQEEKEKTFNVPDRDSKLTTKPSVETKLRSSSDPTPLVENNRAGRVGKTSGVADLSSKVGDHILGVNKNMEDGGGAPENTAATRIIPNKIKEQSREIGNTIQNLLPERKSRANSLPSSPTITGEANFTGWQNNKNDKVSFNSTNISDQGHPQREEEGVPVIIAAPQDFSSQLVVNKAPNISGVVPPPPPPTSQEKGPQEKGQEPLPQTERPIGQEQPSTVLSPKEQHKDMLAELTKVLRKRNQLSADDDQQENNKEETPLSRELKEIKKKKREEEEKEAQLAEKEKSRKEPESEETAREEAEREQQEVLKKLQFVAIPAPVGGGPPPPPIPPGGIPQLKFVRAPALAPVATTSSEENQPDGAVVPALKKRLGASGPLLISPDALRKVKLKPTRAKAFEVEKKSEIPGPNMLKRREIDSSQAKPDSPGKFTNQNYGKLESNNLKKISPPSRNFER